MVDSDVDGDADVEASRHDLRAPVNPAIPAIPAQPAHARHASRMGPSVDNARRIIDPVEWETDVIVALRAGAYVKCGETKMCVEEFAHQIFASMRCAGLVSSRLLPLWKQRSVAQRRGLRTMAQAAESGKMILYDVPVSNNGARVRLVVYKKKLQDLIDIKSPAEIGGLSSDAYLALNPEGKMPVLQLEDGSGLPESQVIESYLLDKFSDRSPSLMPATPELRARAGLMVRILDVYICSIQGAMYKPMDSKSERASQIAQLAKQLDVLEGYMVGPYCVGEDMSYADTALVPTFVFMNYILPKYFGWKTIFEDRP